MGWVLASRVWGRAAAGWALAFAGLHLFWAVGGSRGLASSAGDRLARERPTWFVAVGLFGVAGVLVAVAAVGVLLSRRQDRWWGAAVRVLGVATAALLLLRGVALQALLVADPAYGEGAVNPSERHWSLVLWNPWFTAGGALFALGWISARRHRPAASPAGRAVGSEHPGRR